MAVIYTEPLEDLQKDALCQDTSMWENAHSILALSGKNNLAASCRKIITINMQICDILP